MYFAIISLRKSSNIKNLYLCEILADFLFSTNYLNPIDSSFMFIYY